MYLEGMAALTEELIKENCRKSFDACLELAGNHEVSVELFLWLKENYTHLCAIQRWGQVDVETEFQWSLDDDAGYNSVYLEDSMWSNPLMPEDMLIDESDLAEDTQHIESIIKNPNCPVSIIEDISNIQFDDREWIDEVTEEEVEDLRNSAIAILSERS